MGTRDDNQYLLKVFSGPHLGAEVLLPEGDCVIGSDDDCDVIFGDRLIAPRHAKLTLRGESAECTALDGASVLIAGRSVDAAPIAPFEYFTLGNTHLAYGPADGEWPVTEFPDYRLEAAAAPDEPERDTEADEPQQEEVAATPDAASDSATNTANDDGDDQHTKPDASPTVQGGADTRRVALVCLIAFFCLLPLLLFGIAASSGSGTAAAAADESEVRTALEAVIKRHNYADSVDLIDRRGKVGVDGYVSTTEDRRALRDSLAATLREKLGRIDYSRLKLWDTEQLATAAADVARMYDLPIAARAGEPGEVVLEGELPSKQDLPKLLTKIKEDVPKIRELTDRTKVEGAEPTPARKAEKSASAVAVANETSSGANEAPAFTPQTNSNDQKAQLATVIGLPPIQSISIGNTRSITLSTGQRVYRGAILRSGYTVSRIEIDQVTLVRNGKQQVVKVGI